MRFIKVLAFAVVLTLVAWPLLPQAWGNWRGAVSGVLAVMAGAIILPKLGARSRKDDQGST